MKGYLPAPAAVGDAHSPEVRRGAAGAPAAAAPRAPPGGRAGSGRRAGKRSRSRANPSAGVGLREEQGCSSSLRQAESPARAGGAGQLCQARGAPSGSARTRLARLGSARFGSAATRARSATRSSSVRSSTIRSGCNWFGMPRLGVVRFGSVQGSAPGLSATRLGAAGRSPHGAISGLAGRAGLAAGGAEGCVCVMEASVCVCVHAGLSACRCDSETCGCVCSSACLEAHVCTCPYVAAAPRTNPDPLWVGMAPAEPNQVGGSRGYAGRCSWGSNEAAAKHLLTSPGAPQVPQALVVASVPHVQPSPCTVLPQRWPSCTHRASFNAFSAAQHETSE